MLRPNAIKARLAADEEVFGLFCSIADPTVVELIGCAGFDFVILDSASTRSWIRRSSSISSAQPRRSS